MPETNGRLLTIEGINLLLRSSEVRIQPRDLVVSRLVTGRVQCVCCAVIILEQAEVLGLYAHICQSTVKVHKQTWKCTSEPRGL